MVNDDDDFGFGFEDVMIDIVTDMIDYLMKADPETRIRIATPGGGFKEIVSVDRSDPDMLIFHLAD